MELLLDLWDLVTGGHGQWVIGDLVLGGGLTSLEFKEVISLEVAFHVGWSCDVGNDLAVLLVGWVLDFNLLFLCLPYHGLKFYLLDIILTRRETLPEQGQVDGLAVLDITLHLLELDLLVLVLGDHGRVEGNVKGELLVGRNETSRSNTDHC